MNKERHRCDVVCHDVRVSGGPCWKGFVTSDVQLGGVRFEIHRHCGRGFVTSDVKLGGVRFEIGFVTSDLGSVPVGDTW